jgi:hypothetical protein
MITALALPTKAHVLLTILGECTLLFLVLLLGAGKASRGAWDGRRVSLKRYIAVGCLFSAILFVVAAAAFLIKG